MERLRAIEKSSTASKKAKDAKGIRMCACARARGLGRDSPTPRSLANHRNGTPDARVGGVRLHAPVAWSEGRFHATARACQ